MNGLVLGLYITCLAIFTVDYWGLSKIKKELEVINRYLKDRADKEGE